MTQTYSYADCLAVSQRINWRIEDIIGGDRRLDFTKPFLPESLARVRPLDFLTPAEQLALNHVRALGYLYTFGLVEEFILPFVLDHARAQVHGDDDCVRALVQFAGEEAKHIQLFKRFVDEFEQGFGTHCGLIGPPDEIADAVMAHHPLAVALLILHIEWMTQRHYVDSVRDDRDLDPQFASLLRHHWMEEAQHAKLDTLTIAALKDSCSPQEIDRALDEYVEIAEFLDGAFTQQVQFDLASFTAATGRELSATECERYVAVQTQAIRWTFLGSGLSHQNFLATAEDLKPGSCARFEEFAPTFS